MPEKKFKKTSTTKTKPSQTEFEGSNWYYWNVKVEDNLNGKNKYID